MAGNLAGTERWGAAPRHQTQTRNNKTEVVKFYCLNIWLF